MGTATVLALALAAGQPPAGGAKPGAGTAEAEVRKLEREWLDAYEKRDAAAMDRIVADDFTITFPNGAVQTKAQLMAGIKRPRKEGQPAPRFFTEDVRARAYGDTVVLIGKVVTEVTRDGKAVREESRYTDTYVKRGGRWQVVASHLSNVPPARKEPPAEKEPRPVRDNAVVSPAAPPVRIEVNKKLPHVGSLTFVLKKVAEVERVVFAHPRDGGRVRAMFVAQFESILPGVKGGYSFEVTNPTRLGKHDYQTSVGFFNFAQAAAANPGAEADHTKGFLAKHRLDVGKDDFLVARYARVTDKSGRQELILFYYENLADLGATRADLDPGGRRAADRDKVFRDFAARALAGFKVEDGNP
jgi:uncharacterized protein (TIGR02246 family)